MNRATILWRTIASLLACAALVIAWRCAPLSLRPGGDFSSYWLGSLWLRERPAETPLYYPHEEEGRPNSRIWAAIQKRYGDLLDPWLLFGARHGFLHPKFYLYPPAFALAFTPLTLFSAGTAAHLWALINAAALIAATSLLGRLQKKDGAAPATAAILAIALAMYPTWWSLQLGQNTLLLFLCWTLFATALLQRRDTFAGVMLGILAAVKLNPLALLAWLILRRRWRAVIAASAVFILSLGVGTLCVGIGGMRGYFHDVLPLLATGTHYYENQSLTGFMLRLHRKADSLGAEPGPYDAPLPHWLPAVSLLLLAITHASAIARKKDAAGESGIAAELAAMILVLQIISPISWAHYLVLSLLALVLLARDMLAPPRAWPVFVLAALAFVLQAMPPPPFDFLNASRGHWLMSYRLYGVAMLWLLALCFAWRSVLQKRNGEAA